MRMFTVAVRGLVVSFIFDCFGFTRSNIESWLVFFQVMSSLKEVKLSFFVIDVWLKSKCQVWKHSPSECVKTWWKMGWVRFLKQQASKLLESELSLSYTSVWMDDDDDDDDGLMIDGWVRSELHCWITKGPDCVHVCFFPVSLQVSRVDQSSI